MNETQRIMACTEVTRWHAVGTTRQQTLAEHQWVVAMLASKIAIESDAVSWQSSLAVMDKAMVHDMDEIDGGDPPNFDDPKDIVEKINSMTPIDMCIKFADLIDAAYFSRHYACGVRGKHAAADTLERFFQAYKGCNNRGIAAAAGKVWGDLLDG